MRSGGVRHRAVRGGEPPGTAAAHGDAMLAAADGDPDLELLALARAQLRDAVAAQRDRGAGMRRMPEVERPRTRHQMVVGVELDRRVAVRRREELDDCGMR